MHYLEGWPQQGTPVYDKLLPWTPAVPPWKDKETVIKDSLLDKSIQLWSEKFAGYEELAKTSSQVLFTGIGGAVASADMDASEVRVFGDLLEVPYYVELKKTFKEVPKVLFLVASVNRPDNIIGIKGLAREYKEQGVEKIILITPAMAHEREDKPFKAKVRKPGEKEVKTVPIPAVVTLKDVVQILSLDIDGIASIQGHSDKQLEYGLKYGMPVIPITAFDLLLAHSGFQDIPPEKRFVLGPDKGRGTEAQKLAARLESSLASALKDRARLADGYPTVETIPIRALVYMWLRECIIACLDDEIREAGTIFELTNKLDGWINNFLVCVFKPIFSGEAIERLCHPGITQIITTNAVQPFGDITPIKDKLKVIPLEGDIKMLARYLQHNLLPKSSDWLRNSQETGTLLKLDLDRQ